MRIRHVVAQDNVDETGVIRDPRRVRHCVVVAGRIADLSGEVDPVTHLNRDFPAHQLGPCIVAERLEQGAAVLHDDERLLFAKASPDELISLGPVDLDRRRIDWLAAHRAHQTGRR
jgi:hypothetical protein